MDKRTVDTAPGKKFPRKSREAKREGESVWHIRRAAGLQIVEAQPFARIEWLIHGFSTRPGGVSQLGKARNGQASEKALNQGFADCDSRERVEENRRRFRDALGGERMRLVTLHQVHSDLVHVAEEAPAEAPRGDAICSRTGGLLLGVQTADCIPILLVDRQRRAVAAVHAGWRGTLARVVAKAIGRMRMDFGTQPQDLLAALGPGIGRCCYEVGPEVVKEFAGQFPRASEWFDGPFDALASSQDPNPLPWLTMMPPGHPPAPPRAHLDLRSANRDILADAGVQRKNIFVNDLCTACRTDLFFSYRREGRTGRMMAVIGLC